MSNEILNTKMVGGYEVTFSVTYLDFHKDSGFYTVNCGQDNTTFDFDQKVKAEEFFKNYI